MVSAEASGFLPVAQGSQVQTLCMWPLSPPPPDPLPDLQAESYGFGLGSSEERAGPEIKGRKAGGRLGDR